MRRDRVAMTANAGVHPLRRLMSPPPTTQDQQRCEMCAEPVLDPHSHLVDLRSRALMCTCRGCALLFTTPGAGGGRFAVVPDRVLRERGFALTDSDWDRLAIPVRLAFFLPNSELGRVVAFYPSPAGATECELPGDAWPEVLRRSRLAGMLEPDVEALLLRADVAVPAAYLVPVDACYRLVGLVRLTWKGFDGGTAAREAIDSFFAELESRSREL